uniref:Uncharacterized protein LOC105130969 isoform X2 n=1 Tax=Rhizophora mucronata TaxID=61149 RepID=A0A2P2N0J0_RHIMU
MLYTNLNKCTQKNSCTCVEKAIVYYPLICQLERVRCLMAFSSRIKN